MSHLRPEDRAPRHRRSACKKGRHDYGDPQHVGGGITRQVCRACGDVSIDLTTAYEGERPIVSENRGIISLIAGDDD